MEEKRNKFRILIENGSGLKIEKTNVNPALASNIINELLEQRPSVREREIPTPQQVERDVVEGFQAPDEEYPEPTGRQEPIERGLLPKERVKAVRIGKWSPKGKVGIIKRKEGLRGLIEKKLLEYHQKGRKTLKLQRLITASGYSSAGQNYIIAKEVIIKLGFKIIGTGEKGNPLIIALSKKRNYRDGREETIKRKILEYRKRGRKTIRLKKLLSSCGITRGGEIYEIATRLISKMGFEIIEKRTDKGRGKHQFIVIISEKPSPIKRGKRRKFITEKLLELSNKGKKEIRVDKFIKVAGFNYSTGQLREAIYKEASELGFEITRKGRGRRKAVLIILSKKEGKPERAWKQTRKEQKTKSYIEIKKRLLELSNQGIKRIKQRKIAFGVSKSKHPSAHIYKKIAEVVSDLGFEMIGDRRRQGFPKTIILKEGFKPSPRVKKYSSREIKMRNKLSELSGNGKREVFEGDLLKSIGLSRSGEGYRLLDDVAKDMGFEVIKTGKAKSCRKKIILKKEEPKGSRAYMSIYAKTLNEWEKIPTPFNLRQATFKLFGVMGEGYNYNLTSMNVGQALNKLVRQGKLVRKKVLGTVQASGKKGWKKEMWLYDLPKEGEEPQEVAPEPQEDIELPVLSEDTLISVFNQHIEISPKTFCGFYTKTGQPITERQARFLFYWIRDNLSFVQGLTGKKITIGGYGQWQTIKIK